MYTTISSEVRHSIVVKNSEFLAFAASVSSVQLALSWLKQLRKRYPDSSHVCWAYKIGSLYRFSDDGEPSGTAGAPIYRVLEMSGLDFLVLAVVRYYGGTNLGAGGLARAYGGAVLQVLQIADRIEVHPRVRLKLVVGFEQTSLLHRLLEPFDLTQRTDTFTQDGLEVCCSALLSDVSKLELWLRDVTRGQGKLEVQ